MERAKLQAIGRVFLMMLEGPGFVQLSKLWWRIGAVECLERKIVKVVRAGHPVERPSVVAAGVMNSSRGRLSWRTLSCL